ncbi:MAG: DUF1285 domain-containing protein [Pseudomonadota bacterium]
MAKQTELDKIKQRIEKRNLESPPLHLWHPTLSGEIDIRIDKDGGWFHEGVYIKRASLVKLFASILRKEDDGEYYLVTPVEKWRITVDTHPLVVVDFEEQVAPENIDTAKLIAQLNTEKRVSVDAEHPFFSEKDSSVPVLGLDYGLSASIARPAWYRLADLALENNGAFTVFSGDYHYNLPRS